MREQPQVGHVVDVFAFDGEVVDALGAGELAFGGDGEGAGAAADDLVVVDILGGDPVVAGVAVEPVGAGGAELFAAAVGIDGRELPDVVVKMVDGGEDEAARIFAGERRLEAGAWFDGDDGGLHFGREAHFDQVERQRHVGARLGGEVLDPFGRLERGRGLSGKMTCRLPPAVALIQEPELPTLAAGQ